MTDRLRIADEVAELLSRAAAVASLGRLRLLERKAALPSELLRLVMGNPLWMFFEREIDVVRVGDPDGPVDLPFYFLRLRFPEDESVSADLDRLRLVFLQRQRRIAAAEPTHEPTLTRRRLNFTDQSVARPARATCSRHLASEAVGTQRTTFPVLPIAALGVGVVGYVLFFYVRSATLPIVGLLLMVLAAVLAVVAIARSDRRATTAVGFLAIVPLAVVVWAVVVWLGS